MNFLVMAQIVTKLLEIVGNATAGHPVKEVMPIVSDAKILVDFLTKQHEEQQKAQVPAIVPHQTPMDVPAPACESNVPQSDA